VYLADEAKFESLELDPALIGQSGLVFAPLANFRNPAYAFWANYVEDFVFDNPSALFDFDGPLEGDFVQGVWAWVGWFYGDDGNEGPSTVEFASRFYSYSDGSELTESGIDDVFEEEATPTTAPAAPATTTPTLAATGANVEWLLVAGLVTGIAGAGFLTASRRKRSS
jgi:LPXTG-motif cell wall-anchored protein